MNFKILMLDVQFRKIKLITGDLQFKYFCVDWMDVNNHSCVNHENMIVSLTLFDNIFVQIVNLLLPIKETLAAFWLLVSSPVSVVWSGATRVLQY